jgi:hypothetical protein
MEFQKHNFGSIRGPNRKAMRDKFHHSHTDLYLSDGVCVAKYFGFDKPTRVQLHYVIEDNKFWMRILDEPLHQLPSIDQHEPLRLFSNMNGTAASAKKNTITKRCSVSSIKHL